MAFYPLVIFDLDGTLVDSLPDIARALNLALAEQARPQLSLAEVKRIVGSGARDLVKSALGAADEALIDLTLERYRQIYRQNPIALSTLYPAVREMLAQLTQEKSKLAVATNKPGAIARQVVAALGIEPYFIRVLGEDDIGARKPDPKMLELLVDEAGVTRAQTLFVGDSEVDLETAERADMDFCFVSYGYAHEPAFVSERAARTVGHFSELMAAFASPVRQRK